MFSNADIPALVLLYGLNTSALLLSTTNIELIQNMIMDNIFNSSFADFVKECLIQARKDRSHKGFRHITGIEAFIYKILCEDHDVEIPDNSSYKTQVYTSIDILVAILGRNQVCELLKPF